MNSPIHNLPPYSYLYLHVKPLYIGGSIGESNPCYQDENKVFIFGRNKGTAISIGAQSIRKLTGSTIYRDITIDVIYTIPIISVYTSIYFNISRYIVFKSE